IDHPGSLDAIDLSALSRIDLDDVARRDVLQSPEEAVAMSGDAQVSSRARLRSTFDEADSAVECAVVGAIQHRHLESNFRDPQHGERRGSRFEQRLTPRRDAYLGPQGQVRGADFLGDK